MSEIDNSNLSYTSRDYQSILRELVDTIPLLTQDWTARDESDPGIVLVKLMAMVGDMLSYNLDKAALELYPESVTQRKNAYQIYNLIGYKMHWYKSARCNARLLINNSNNPNLVIPRYSRFATLGDSVSSIYYTNVKDIQVDANQTSVNVELIQGIPKTPAMEKSVYNYVDGNWWDNYSYNLSSDEFDSQNRYYLNDINVDEDTITLCDDYGEWILVEDIDLVQDINSSTYGNRYYDFRVDEYDRPYIRLCSSWNENNKGSINFRLFYIISAGSNGKISSRTLTAVDRNIAEVINDTSSEGYDPETPYEAWKNSRLWVNTNNTLITCSDFTKAVRRIEGVANAIALDWMNDIQDPIATNMKNYEIRVYVIPDNEYLSRLSDDEYEALKMLYRTINEYLRSCKILHLLQMVYFDGEYDPNYTEIKTSDVIDHYEWSIEGVLYYRTPLDKADSDEIITNVNNTLKLKFSNKQVGFNQAIRYIDVVNTILSCDSRILYVDLRPVVYKKRVKVFDQIGNVIRVDLIDAEEKDVTGKIVIEIEPNPIEEPENWDSETYGEYNPCLYNIDLSTYDGGAYADTLPIKPSTVSIKIDSGNFNIYDDGNGKLVSGIVEGENSIIANSKGTIDYGRYENIEEGVPNPDYGKMSFELRYATASNLILSYKKNQLAMAEYVNLNPEKFYASSDSLKRRI